MSNKLSYIVATTLRYSGMLYYACMQLVLRYGLFVSRFLVVVVVVGEHAHMSMSIISYYIYNL